MFLKKRLGRQHILTKIYVILASMILPFLLWNYSSNSCYNRMVMPGDVDLLTDHPGDLLACSAIIRGDSDGLEHKHLSRLLQKRIKQNVLSESFYLNKTRDCDTYIRDRGFLTAAMSKEEKDFPIAFSMVVHENIEMFERLLRAIYMPQNVYCVHVDQKSPEGFTKAVRAIVSCLPNVFVARKLERVVYASWSRVQADINCMEDLLKSRVQWRYLLNTCGTDFPIKSNAEMVRTLKVLNGKNSMESEKTPDGKKGRWQYHHNVTNSVTRTDVKKSPPPISSPMFSGNAYFVVTREFVENLFQSQEVQGLMEWEKDTYSPDEHLWATLQRMPGVPGSNPPNGKYEASDMNAVARLVKWAYLEGDVNNGATYPPCTGTHRRAVCVYGAGDLSWILKHHHLFANKFDPKVDDVAIKCLETYLRYKTATGKSLETLEHVKIMKR